MSLKEQKSVKLSFSGEDEESDKALRKRTIDYLKTPTLNGNVAQYKKGASELWCRFCISRATLERC